MTRLHPRWALTWLTIAGCGWLGCADQPAELAQQNSSPAAAAATDNEYERELDEVAARVVGDQVELIKAGKLVTFNSSIVDDALLASLAGCRVRYVELASSHVTDDG